VRQRSAAGHVQLRGQGDRARRLRGDQRAAVGHIGGELDDQGREPRIVGGRTPFLVDAPGAVVRIRGLRFVRPISRAIQVGSAMEAMIARCVIEAVQPITAGDATFGIVAGGPFTAPINRLEVVDNTIAEARQSVYVGVILAPSGSAVGSTEIAHNDIRASAHGVDLRTIGGKAAVHDNPDHGRRFRSQR
jgi:hypothetical protein